MTVNLSCSRCFVLDLLGKNSWWKGEVELDDLFQNDRRPNISFRKLKPLILKHTSKAKNKICPCKLSEPRPLTRLDNPDVMTIDYRLSMTFMSSKLPNSRLGHRSYRSSSPFSLVLVGRQAHRIKNQNSKIREAPKFAVDGLEVVVVCI